MATEEQTSYNAILSIAGFYPRFRGGQKLTISNRTVSKLAFVLNKYGSPTGDVTFEIIQVASPFATLASKVWGSAASLQTEGNEQWEEVEFGTPVAINEEVRAVVYYPDSLSNFRVRQHYQNTDVKASEQQTFFGSSWTDSPTADCAYKYTYTTKAIGGGGGVGGVGGVPSPTGTGILSFPRGETILKEERRVSTLTPEMPMSDIEAIVYQWLTRKNIEFQFQTSLMGGFYQLGGTVVDFLIPSRNLAWRVQGEYFHSGVTKEGSDLIQREMLTELGWTVVDLFSNDIIDKTDETLTKALQGIEMLR